MKMSLINKVDQFNDDVDIAHQIVHGDATKTVITEGGPVRSLAKLIADKDAEFVGGDVVQQAVAARDAAKEFKVGAELARDAAMVGAVTYPDEATGRAAVADGAYFKVIGSGDVAAREYRRMSASTSELVAVYPNSEPVMRSASLSASYPFADENSVNNAGGNQDLLYRIYKGVLDVRLFGFPSTDTYYIERLRRNFSGNWHIVIKRASDNVSVLQYFAALTEPSDPTVPMVIDIPGLIVGVFGRIAIRWSDFVSGQTNSGLTIKLSSEVLNYQYPSFLNTLPAFSARAGNIVLPFDPLTFASVDETTRTFTWPMMDIIAGEANSSARYRLEAGSVSLDSPRKEIAWLDLREAATYGKDNVPSSAVKVGTYTSGALRTSNDYVGEPHQLPLAWSPGGGRVDVNPIIRTTAPPTNVGYTEAFVVKRDLPNNFVSIYYKANGRSSSSTYIHVGLLHHVSVDTDAWTIAGVWEVQRTGYESFTIGKRLIVESTEILAAFQEQGAADFMGSRAHGDELLVGNPTLIIDGSEVSLNSGPLAWYHANKVMLIQKTRMYRVGSNLTVPLIERGLMLSFADGEFISDQRFEFLEDFILQNGYCAMMAPHRYETYVTGVSEDTGSAQISGKYAHNGKFTPMDVSARQAVTDPIADYARLTPPVTRVKMWGTYGAEFEVEVLEATDILKDIFFIQRNNYTYNKAYIGFIGGYSGVQTVTTGQQWTIKSRYSIRSKN